MTYQERYLAHQARKKEQLAFSVGETPPRPARDVFTALAQRRSQRLFTEDVVTEEDIEKLLATATTAPSSCNRHGIRIRVVQNRYEKNLLSGLLVGGTGWCHRASVIFLFMADPEAYASPNEKGFMHYCDVGFTAMSMWLAAEQLGLGAAYINPNVIYLDVLREMFTGEYEFVGALAAGAYSTRVKEAEHPEIKDIVC